MSARIEKKGRVLCRGKIQDLQSNQTFCLFLEVKHHGFLMQGVCFICHLWNAFLLVLFFGDFFFSDTVLLVLLWVLTKKRLMNIKGTNFTANHLQYTCYIQFLLAYLHIFFSSDLEQCPGLNNKKLFMLSGYTYYFQLMKVDRSEPK